MKDFSFINLKNPPTFRRSFRTWIGILFLLGIPLFFLSQYHTWTRSLPKTEGELAFSPLRAKVRVFRDGYSIPHIFSKNEYDLFFAQGFVTAQDRLWQMDILRRIANGQLSEIFGTKTVATDSLMRFIGLGRFVLEWKPSLSKTSRTILQAYTDGVNAYQNRMPIEARFLGYKIAPWTIEDCLAVYLLFAFQSDIRWIAEPFLMAMSHPKELDKVLDSYVGLLSRSLEEAFLGVPAMGMGCAVTGSKTETGNPLLLAFLPVTRISMPTYWYEIYLSSPQWHVRGFSIPGFPFVYTGFNGHIAWVGMPSGEKDVHFSAVPIEKDKKWISHTEWILVKNKEKCAFDFYLHSGKPVWVSSPQKNAIGLELDWSGFSLVDVPFGFYRLVQAKDLQSFQKAIEQISTPPTIWVYGDTSGKLSGLFFRNGKFQFFSPKEMLIVTDFQIRDFNSQISTAPDLSSPFRVERILTLCQKKDPISGIDLKAIATDQISLLALQFLQLALPKIASEASHDPFTQETFELLSKWEGNMDPGNSSALITETWMHQLISELYRESMGENTFSLFSKLFMLPYQSLIKWLEDPPVDSTAVKAILLRNLRNALQEIKGQWGESPSSWNWANAHTLIFQHPLDDYALLRRILDAGPFPVQGSTHTIAGWTHDFRFPFRISSGPGARMLVDLKNPDHSISILSTGQSGQALDVHYRDQLPLFLQNCYHPALWDSVKMTRSGWKKLILKPKDSL